MVTTRHDVDVYGRSVVRNRQHGVELGRVRQRADGARSRDHLRQLTLDCLADAVPEQLLCPARQQTECLVET